MRIKDLLKKSITNLTDEELKYIGYYFFKHPEKLKEKEKVKLHKCIHCKHLMWYDCLGYDLWECQKNPCHDLKTESDKLLNNRQITHKRKCENFDRDKNWHNSCK